MIYLKLFWDIFTFKSFKVAMYFICSLAVLLMLGFYSNLQSTWRGLFDQGGESPFFYALLDNPIPLAVVKDRLLGFSSIKSIKAVDGKQVQFSVQQQLREFGLSMPADLVPASTSVFEIELKTTLSDEQRGEARKEFLQIFLKDGVMATEVVSPRSLSELGPTKRWLRDYFLLSVLGLLALLSLLSLWEFARESSYRANVIESFHRTKNIGLKTYLISWMPVALLGSAVGIIYGASDWATVLFLVFWLLLNLSVTIMCQHVYFMKKIY